MAKRRPSTQAIRNIDPGEILSGRVHTTLDGLLELIQRVNPTGRDCDPGEEQARYQMKSRLQSLLIHRFAEHLEVEPDPRHEGVVSLGRLGRVREGCHAVISELDDDARSWIRFQLDVADSAPRFEAAEGPRRAAQAGSPRRGGSSAGTAAAPAASTDDLLRRAERSLDAYDYDQARIDLEEALASSGGATRPAAALLSLLVDTLGADTDALAVEGSLSSAALADRGVRGVLALAAARTGDETGALARVPGIEPARCAEVFAALATTALRRGDIERAAEHLAEARRSDPTFADQLGVAEELARARAAARAPAEAELARIFEAGRDSEAARRAQEVLARWPDSAPAARILREIESRKRHEEARKKVLEGDDSLARGERSVALSLFRHALSMLPAGPEAALVEARCAAVEAALREEREEAAVAGICRRLDAPDRTGALLAYLDLSAALRSRVRHLCPLEELAWLETTAGSRDRARVEAVLALVRARELLEADPDRAMDLLAPHRAALEPVPEAKRVGHEAAARSREARTARARAEAAAAHAAFDAGDMRHVIERLGDAVVRDLPGDERDAAVALRALAATAVDRQHRMDAVARLRAAGRLFDARAALLAILASEPEEAKARLQDEHDALTEEIQRELRVEVDTTTCDSQALGVPEFYLAGDSACHWLTRDGRTMVLAEAYERWILVRLYDIEGGCVRASAMLRTPEAMGHLDVTVDGDLLWLAGESGALLCLTLSDWQVRSFHGSAELPLGGSIIEEVRLGPAVGAQRHLWVRSRAPGMGGAEKLRVIDVERGRTVREAQDTWSVVPLPGPDDPRVACIDRAGVMLYSGRGSPVPGGRLPVRGNVLGVALHPSGSGLVVLTSAASWDTTTPTRCMEVPFTSNGGLDAPRSNMIIDGSDSELPHSIASGREPALVAVTSTGDNGTELLAWSPAGGALTLLYRVPAPAGTLLVIDDQGRHVCALCPGPEGLDAFPLDAAAPELPPRRERPVVSMPRPYDLATCGFPTGERGERIKALARHLDGTDPPQIGRWVRERRKAFAAAPADLLDTMYALELCPMSHSTTERKELAEWLHTAMPDHPEVQLLFACHLAAKGRWKDAFTAVEAVDASSLDRGLRKHLHHVTAFTAGYAGSSQAMRDALAWTEAEDGQCAVQSLEDIAFAGEGPIPDGPNATARLIHAIRAADERFAASDFGVAIALLDTPLVRFAREVQSLARLAEAHLQVEPASRLERFRKRLALGRFLDADKMTSPSLRRELPLGDAHWDPSRLSELSARVRAYLDGPSG